MPVDQPDEKPDEPNEPDEITFPEPDHLDFHVLQAMVEQLGLEAEAAGDAYQFNDVVGSYVDSPSLDYLATMRAMIVLGVTNGEQLIAAQREVFNLAVAYQEGFVMGVRFQQTKQPPLSSFNDDVGASA